MIYLDCAATSLARPPQVSAAMVAALETFGNASRGAHGPALESMRCLLATRQAAAHMFGVADVSRVILTPGATYSLNVAIGSIHGHIITTTAEHNSVLRPVYRHGNYTIAPPDERLFKALRPDTEAIVMTHASNVTGDVYDIRSVGQFCHDHGLRFIVDASQTAGLLPIDVDASHIDALCFSGHKSLLGPQGIGMLCLGKGFLPGPLVVGGSGVHSYEAEHPAFLPDRLEAGTANAHAAAGLLAGLNYLAQPGNQSVLAANALARQFADSVASIPGLTLYGDLAAQVRLPIVSLNIHGLDAATIASQLWDEYGIAVRAGAHCAPLMHEALRTQQTGAVRFSFSAFNTAQEVDPAASALRDIVNSR